MIGRHVHGLITCQRWYGRCIPSSPRRSRFATLKRLSSAQRFRTFRKNPDARLGYSTKFSVGNASFLAPSLDFRHQLQKPARSCSEDFWDRLAWSRSQVVIGFSDNRSQLLHFHLVYKTEQRGWHYTAVLESTELRGRAWAQSWGPWWGLASQDRTESSPSQF